MTIAIAEFVKLDQEKLVAALEEASKNLENDEKDVVVDLSSVQRLDSATVKWLEEFADAADAKGVKAALLGANIGICKVLKLVRLTSRFSFVVRIRKCPARD